MYRLALSIKNENKIFCNIMRIKKFSKKKNIEITDYSCKKIIKYENYSDNKMNYIYELNGYKPIVICTGPTGTGKTYLACQEGINQLHNYKKILITRPAVSIHNEQHGFLPGSLEDKMAPWFRPIYDNIENAFGKDYLTYLLKNKIIDMCPFAYIRGRTFNNTFIIADEMQNATEMQFKTLLTRLGSGSKLVINGDLSQSDNDDNNGLLDFLFLYNKYLQTKNSEYISIVELYNEDIIRHPAVNEILDIYDS
jgi:phosphate starvation-inducible PhoH-like protein